MPVYGAGVGDGCFWALCEEGGELKGGFHEGRTVSWEGFQDGNAIREGIVEGGVEMGVYELREGIEAIRLRLSKFRTNCFVS